MKLSANLRKTAEKSGSGAKTSTRNIELFISFEFGDQEANPTSWRVQFT
jgi:hypothetical protein